MLLSESLTHLRRRGHSLANLPIYLARMVRFAWLRGRGKKSKIHIRFGEEAFTMHVLPLGPKEGSRGIYLFREYYEPLLAFGHGLLKPGDIALDVGANQGIYCCAFALAVGPAGRVIAVEPIPRQAQRLKNNIETNAFSHCTVVEKAISDSDGVAMLELAGGDTSASILPSDHVNAIEVRTTTIDGIVAAMALPHVDFVKLDVEGAELLALSGAINTLQRYRPTLSIEAADPLCFKKIQSFLAPLGYLFSEFDRAGRLVPFDKLLAPADNIICLPRSLPLPG
jgi:FkbM family methyltransferase